MDDMVLHPKHWLAAGVVQPASGAAWGGANPGVVATARVVQQSRLTNVPGPWLQITEAANSKWYRLEKIDLLAQEALAVANATRKLMNLLPVVEDSSEALAAILQQHSSSLVPLRDKWKAKALKRTQQLRPFGQVTQLITQWDENA
ncbi:MAG: hypothetical protein FRX49_06917 [Trebouxia sp. A1-2]|nr:MAG: hypothetical protein FRX49_06917 [Trebouxia sp. A1-2]